MTGPTNPVTEGVEIERAARAICEIHARRGLANDWTASLRPITDEVVAREVERSWRHYIPDAEAAAAALNPSPEKG